MRKKLSIEEAFWPKVDKRGDDECWEWLAGVSKPSYTCRGYGSFFHPRFKGHGVRAHRVAYELFYGITLNRNVVVCHVCDNTRCCNPHHLVLSSNKANMRDAAAKGRLSKPKRRFTDDTVRCAHQLVMSGLSGHQAADLLGVNARNVNMWIIGATHRNVYEEFHGPKNPAPAAVAA